MKKTTAIFMLFCLTASVFGEKFKTLKDSGLYQNLDGIRFEHFMDIEKNQIVEVTDSSIVSIPDAYKYGISAKYSYITLYADAENLVPADTKDLFDEQILTSFQSGKNKKWVSKLYFDLLKKKDRTYITKIQPFGYDKFESQRGEFDYPYTEQFAHVSTADFFNCSVVISDFFNYCSFVVKNIEKQGTGYKVTGVVDSWFAEDIQKKCKKSDEVVLNFKFDGDFLVISFDSGEVLASLVLIDSDTYSEIEKFMRTNTCNYSKIKWPRNAGSSSSSKTSTNVASGKLMTAKENLKLRSGEATSSQVLTVMSSGTRVKILELGKSETIDGINSNWVKVEVQSGAKDRDGKAIKPGTVGWCYGGYLN